MADMPKPDGSVEDAAANCVSSKVGVGKIFKSLIAAE